MNVQTFTINYKTIRNMHVSIDLDNFSVNAIRRSFVKGFINYMTKNSLVSDDVLISSIGATNCREAMVAGFEDMVKGYVDNDLLSRYLEYLSDDHDWEDAVILERRGYEEYMRHKFGEMADTVMTMKGWRPCDHVAK